MKLLVLDPATSTGYCLVDIDEEKNKANIYAYGFIDVCIDSDYQGDHCINLMEQVQKLIDEYKINHIAIEDYFFTKRFANGCNVNSAYRTAIHILARKNNIEYSILNVSAWKTFIAGRSTPTKEDKKKWGADAAKKLFIQKALWDKFGFKFPNHSLSKTTGKPIVFRYDIVDVVAQATYFCGLICHITDISLTVEIPTDFVFKRQPKKSFEYPN